MKDEHVIHDNTNVVFIGDTRYSVTSPRLDALSVTNACTCSK